VIAAHLETFLASFDADPDAKGLPADTQVPAHRREHLERLLRSMARGAVALERLYEDARGDLVYTCTKPWSDGTTGITLSPVALLEKLAALVPLPRVHLVRSGRCLAPHSLRCGAIIPTPRQQGVDGHHTTTESSHWSWARRLQRVFALALTRCPFCQRGALRIIAAITHEALSTSILRPLHLASIPPPLAPARSRQETFDWVASAHAIACGLVGDVRATEGCLVSGRHLCAFDIPSPPACPAPRHPWRSPPLPPLAARVQPQGDHAVPLYAWRWGPLAGRPRGAGDAGGAAGAAWPLAGGARGLQGAHA